MSVRVKRYSKADGELGSFPNGGDFGSIQDRETTVDGQTFHWGPNQVRNFLDDGVGAAHAAFNPPANVKEDAIPFGSSRS
jgi:hypothetical protein